MEHHIQRAEVNAIHSRQAAHSQRTQEMIYGRSDGEHPYLTASNLQDFFHASKQWHALLELDIEQRHAIITQRRPDPTQVPSSETTTLLPIQVQPSILYEPQVPSTSDSVTPKFAADTLVGLRRMMKNPNATFKSAMQAEAFSTVAHRKQDVLAVMATGSGKSLLFLLPAFIEKQKVTVVILPLLSLIQDMTRRCQEHDIPYTTWTGGQQSRIKEGVVFIIADNITEDVETECRLLCHDNRLSRIVVDECHVLVQWCSFRPFITNADRLITIEVPLLLLTGISLTMNYN